MKINFIIIFIILSTISFGQTQTFASKGFKVKCECNLKVNTTFIKMMEQQSTQNIFAAYTCAQNNTNPETGVIYNINIYDFTNDYRNMKPSQYSSYEKSYLKSYARQLADNNMTYTYVTYLGVNAIQYDFDQMGLPTKAIMFMKNKKSYLLQVATNLSLLNKFTSFKNSFSLL